MMAQYSVRRQTGGEPRDLLAVRFCYFVAFGQMPPMKRDIAARRIATARRGIVARLALGRAVRGKYDSESAIRSRA
jgi:hypothetical protein